MIDQAKLREVIPVFLEKKDLDDIEISQAIETMGVSLSDAERISAFLPSGFCCIALSHKFDLGFPDSYMVHDQKEDFYYKDEPIYKMGIELAAEIYHNEPELGEVFNSIVTRSAEFNVINQALNEGAEIAGAALSPTSYFGYKTLGKKRGIFSKVFS